MTGLSGQLLQRIMPRCANAALWAPALNSALVRFDIDSPARVAAFLAQIAHESGEMNRLTENLNYSAERLRAVWPKRFPSLKFARDYERKPEKIANYVYASRLGNGDEASGDGWRYRGRGLIQLTGRGNYGETGREIGLPLESDPDLLAKPEAAAMSAAYFWKSRGLNVLADDRNDDDDDEDFVTITRRINGGRVGLEDRRKYWSQAKQILATLPAPVIAPRT
jgi:putative chitinase